MELPAGRGGGSGWVGGALCTSRQEAAACWSVGAEKAEERRGWWGKSQLEDKAVPWSAVYNQIVTGLWSAVKAQNSKQFQKRRQP